MNSIYSYTNLSEIELCPEFLRMRKLINVFGYPNNIAMHTYSGSSKTEFVNSETNEILVCVETVNDGTVFSTQIKYYGDWWK